MDETLKIVIFTNVPLLPFFGHILTRLCHWGLGGGFVQFEDFTGCPAGGGAWLGGDSELCPAAARRNCPGQLQVVQVISSND